MRKKNKKKKRKRGYAIIGVVAVAVLASISTVGALNGWFGGGGSVPQDTTTLKLMGYWNFDEGSGSIAYDASGLGHHGQLATYVWVCGTDTVDDVDGNTYNTVLIGDQCWTVENMRTTKYPNESSITKGDATHGGSGWDTDQAQYSCPPNSTNNGEDCSAATTLGMLYQWSAAMNGASSCNGTGSSQPECTNPVQGICPDGWHIPSHYEWTKLERQICNDNSESDCTVFLYDESTTGWLGYSEGSDMANDVAAQSWTDYAGGLRQDAHFSDSGLDIPPSGYRYTNGNYYGRSYYAYLWSSFQYSDTSAWYRRLRYSRTDVYRYYDNRAYGFSVRCLRD